MITDNKKNNCDHDFGDGESVPGCPVRCLNCGRAKSSRTFAIWRRLSVAVYMGLFFILSVILALKYFKFF